MCWVEQKYILTFTCLLRGLSLALAWLPENFGPACGPCAGLRAAQPRPCGIREGHVRGETGRESPTLLGALGVVSGLCHPQRPWRPSQHVPKAGTDSVCHTRETEARRVRNLPEATQTGHSRGRSWACPTRQPCGLGAGVVGGDRQTRTLGGWEAASTEGLCLAGRGCGASTTR